jgi:hypothetical protein
VRAEERERKGGRDNDNNFTTNSELATRPQVSPSPAPTESPLPLVYLSML